MARLLGPEPRLAYIPTNGRLHSAAGHVATVYIAVTGSALADIATYDGTSVPGTPILNSQIVVDSNSLIPYFWFPENNISRVFVEFVGGPRMPAYALHDQRIVSLEQAIIAISGSSLGMTSPIDAVIIKDPDVTGVYTYSLVDAPGVVAANTFMSLFNPIGSGKTVTLFGGTAAAYVAASSSTVRSSLRFTRVTSVSGGVLQSTSSICKFSSTYPNSIVEIRTNNPTTVTGAVLATLPPAINPASVPFQFAFPMTSGMGPFRIAPGEGIIVHTLVGDVDQTWNITIIWGET